MVVIKKLFEEKNIHRAFDVILIGKGIIALFEIIGGVAVYFISQQFLLDLVTAITQDELMEDPRDVISLYLIHSAQGFSISSQLFTAFFLLSHGVIKMFLIIGIIREKLWYYPTGIVVFLLFILYQLYRFSFTHSIWLLVITVVDVFVIVLTWHEYNYIKKKTISHPMNRVEGFIAVEGGNVWYQIVGDPKGTPLIILHGGPGYPHDYLEPLEDLAMDRQVIFYDQLGCGNSDKTTDSSLWTVENFVAELERIVDVLKLEKYHILGQSWGSALAVAFTLTKPKGLVSLIFSDPFISTPLWVKDAEHLINSLPQDMQEALKNSTKESEEYKRAAKEYYAQFVRRLDPYPEACQRSDQKQNKDIYHYMWGPEEYRVTGTLKDFDPTPRFSEINIPVLLLCGRYDEATPETSEYFKSLLSNARLKVFEDSAHFPFWNQREEYMQTVRDFLQEF